MLSDVDENCANKWSSRPTPVRSRQHAASSWTRPAADAQRAAQELENKSPSPSQALAAGSRAQQGTATICGRTCATRPRGRFTTTRCARCAARRANWRVRRRTLAAVWNRWPIPAKRSLDDSAPRQQLMPATGPAAKRAHESFWHNMQSLTEQAETTEPLLSQQLYDTLRQGEARWTRTTFSWTRAATGGSRPDFTGGAAGRTIAPHGTLMTISARASSARRKVCWATKRMRCALPRKSWTIWPEPLQNRIGAARERIRTARRRLARRRDQLACNSMAQSHVGVRAVAQTLGSAPIRFTRPQRQRGNRTANPQAIRSGTNGGQGQGQNGRTTNSQQRTHEQSRR